MLKRTFAILISIIGLTAGFSAYAASGTCPTDNGAGVGCNIGIGEYYCLSACRTGQTQCPNWTGTVCATGLTCPANCASADSCGYCNSCTTGYTLCGSYPSQTCTANTTAPDHCSSYNQCTATCTACAQGYELLAGQCIGATLKLGSDSVGTGGAIYQSSNPALYVLSSGSVGIGTSTPNATLELAPVSGYSILAGNFKLGNVALPTADADAATKGYVDSVVASATSSISNLWGGTTGGNIWSLNSGNVGIGTSTPGYKLHINSGDIMLNGGSYRLSNGLTISQSVFYAPNGLQFQGYSGGVVDIMKLTSSGNVGIGTTTPSAQLHVNTTSTTGLRIDIPGTNPNAIFIGNATARLRWSNGSYFSNTGMYSGGSNQEYLTYDGTDVQTRLFINAASGNIGIGTVTPLARLEVVPASGYSILAGNFKIGNVALPTADADAATKGYVDSTIAAATSSITGLPTGTTGQTLRHNGTTWVANSVLYNNGTNIGIGTSAPLDNLDVLFDTSSGNRHFRTYSNLGVRLQRADDSVTSAMSYGFLSNPGSDLGGFGALTDGTGAAMNYFFIGSSYSSPIAVFSNGGNVGVGITNPGAHLQVGLLSAAGAGTPPASVTLAGEYLHLGGSEWGSGYRAMGFGYVSGATYSPAYIGFLETNTTGKTLGDLVFGTRNVTTDTLATEQMRITSAGNVGIGTTSPTAKLEVMPTSGYSILAGNFKIGNVALPTADADAATKGYVDSTVASATSSISNLWGGTTDGNIWNLNSGSVGIGTINPTYQLDVKGTTTSSAIRSDMGFDIYPVPNPIASTLSGTSSGGSVDAGLHYYYVTYVTAIGDSGQGGGVGITVPSGSNTVTLNIPVSSDPRVIGRKIYRTKAGDASYNEYYLATVNDNTTTTYTDTTADSALTIFRPILNKTNATTNYITVGGVRAMVLDPKATIVGYGAGVNITTGGMSVLLGPSTGYSMTTSVQNVAIGHHALYSTTSGNNNNAIGYYAMRLNTTGGSNIAMGYYTLYNNQTGSFNTAIGNSAMTGAAGQSNSYNTAIGYMSLFGITTGTYNTALGINSGAVLTSGANNIFLGSHAGKYETGSNRLIIDSVNRLTEERGRDEALIYGITNATPSSQILALGGGGNVGIGTTTPTAKLEVIPSSGYSILAGSFKIGNVALPTADADAATKGYVDSTVASATSSITSIASFVGVTSSTFTGNSNGNSGYAYAHAQCAAAYPGSHVCAAFEILNTIKNGGSVPSQDAWIFNGPPAYTAMANDCDARTSGTSAAYGAYWQKPATGYPEGRGLLIQCNNVLRFACCK